MQNTFESNVHYWLSHSIWYLFYCDTNTLHHNLLKKLNIAKVCNHVTAIYFEQIRVLNITNTRMSIFIQCMYENCMERKQNNKPHTHKCHVFLSCISLPTKPVRPRCFIPQSLHGKKDGGWNS